MSYEYPDVLHKVDGGIDRLANITTINTLPPTLLSARILPQMAARKTRVIVNVGSSASANQMTLLDVYSTTKSRFVLNSDLSECRYFQKYVSWLTAIIRKEYESQGIINQTIAPMMMDTKMSKVKRTSFFNPDGAKFAKSALNTVGNSSDTTGYISHQLQLELMDLIPTFIRDKILTNMSVGTRVVTPRKKERQAKS
uniref:SDR family NAD(P)-dependent oxidoreductase n=1 Tax=Caenorhabditis tropicalis TaxID=1561998 RepID=A0A1I7TMM2_9PELO